MKNIQDYNDGNSKDNDREMCSSVQRAMCAVGHSTDPGVRLPELDPGSNTWANCFTFLCLGFLICKMRIILVSI